LVPSTSLRSALLTRAAAVVLAAAAVTACLAGPASADAGGAGVPVTSAAALAADAAWIERVASPDGSLATNPDRRIVWPYGANYAAMGLARAAVAGDHVAARVGWWWLDWYQAHQDARGYVTDYYRNGSDLVSSGSMDSTDAYAGTFLVAVGDMFAATRDQRHLSVLHRGIYGAVRAIESTQDVDGLTWALPSVHVKYLMDQAEAYAGLVAASRVASSLDDDALSARAALDATRVRAGVESLWNARRGAYDWAVHQDGSHATTNWSVLYPDAMEQAWTVSFGLAPGARGAALLDRLNTAQPSWASPAGIATFGDGRSKVGYWPVAAWPLSSYGRSVSGVLGTLRSAMRRSRRVWPFTSATAGQLMVAESAPIPPVTVDVRIRSLRRF
jgi:hypothetical protein